MDYNLKYYCDVFADQMDFKDAKQRRNFKAKMKNYTDDDYNLSHMLFKLCVKLHKDLENRPDQDSFFKDKVTHTWIYSPQSYEIYMNNLQVTIKDFPNSQRLAQYKQEILDNIEIKEILQENQ